MSFNKIVSFLTLMCFLQVQAIVTDEEYASMPQLFHLDDYDKCMLYGEKGLFCYTTYQLSPINPENTSDIWNIIAKVIKIPHNYRHDRVRHGYCIGFILPELVENITLYQNDNTLLKTPLTEYMNRKYADIELKTTIIDVIRCETINKRPYDVYDYGGGVFLLLIVAVITAGSFYEGLARYKSKEEYDRITKSTLFGKIISSFSIIRNWERLLSTNTHPDAKSLRVINGIRFYNILAVLLAHAALVGFGSPSSNPMYVEQITKNVLTLTAVNGYYAIQAFFVLAGWLLCYHMFLVHEEKKEIKFSYIVLAFVNRYIRITPAYLVMIVFNATWLYHLDQGPIWYKAAGFENEVCRKNWWANLLYINNFYDPQNMCIQQSWYLATDTQLFLVAVILLTLMLKFKKFIKYFFGALLAISVIVPALMTYINDYDIVLRLYPEPLYTSFLDYLEWHVMYASPFVNFGGYVIGMIFGYLYYTYRNENVYTTKKHIAVGWILTFGLTFGIIYLGVPIYHINEKPNIILCAIYGGTAKVLFALGIAIGMFGVSQNHGWFLKHMLTWKPIHILGRLTYCVFLVHTSIIRVKGGTIRSPVYNSTSTLIFNTLGDYISSLLFALILCLAVELPISAIQKIFIPQLENKRANNQINKNIQEVATNGVVNKEDKLTPV